MDRREFYSNLADSREVLEHAEGFQRANHKYVNRFRGRNGKWIYEYAEDLKEKANATAAKAKKTLGSAGNDAKKSLDSAGNDAKKTLTKAKARVSKGMNMASKFGAAKLKELSKASDTAIAKGKYHLANLKNKVEKPTAPEEWKKYQSGYETYAARAGKYEDDLHKADARDYTSNNPKDDRKKAFKEVQSDYSVSGNANKQRQIKREDRRERINYKKSQAGYKRLGATYDKALDSVYERAVHNNKQASQMPKASEASKEYKEEYVNNNGDILDKNTVRNHNMQEDRDKLQTARKSKEAAAHKKYLEEMRRERNKQRRNDRT